MHLRKLCICLAGKGQETPHKGIALSFNFWAPLPPLWSEYFLARLFSQAGLESLDVICVPRNSWRKNGCNALHCSLPVQWMEILSLCKDTGFPPRNTARVGKTLSPRLVCCVIPVGSRHTSGPGLRKFPAFHQSAAQGALG